MKEMEKERKIKNFWIEERQRRKKRKKGIKKGREAK